jgi:hypothetical protein
VFPRFPSTTYKNYKNNESYEKGVSRVENLAVLNTVSGSYLQYIHRVWNGRNKIGNKLSHNIFLL